MSSVAIKLTVAGAVALMFSLVARSTVLAEYDVLRPSRDDVTQLVLDSCPNLVQAQFDDGRHEWTFQVCGLVALYEKLESYSRQPELVLIRDYASLADAKRIESMSGDSTYRAKPRFVRASAAWYLFDAKGDESVTQAPHIYAFKSKAAAEKAQSELGGKLLNWTDVSRRAKELAADWDRHGGREVQTYGGRPR